MFGLTIAVLASKLSALSNHITAPFWLTKRLIKHAVNTFIDTLYGKVADQLCNMN